MSICSCSYRAFSRFSVPKSKTLTPFLYHTATIQRCRSAAQPIARRNASSRSNSGNEIPFEGESLPASVDEVQPSRPTTITGSERAAFEKLYKKFKGPEHSKGSSGEHELDQIADEYYEDDEENDPNPTSLDSLFDAVLSGKAVAEKGKKKMFSRRGQRSADLATLAEEVLKPELFTARKAASQRNAMIMRMRHKERWRIRELLEAANTDKELWDILEREVFSVIRTMDLDIEKKKGKHGEAKDNSSKIATTRSSSSPTSSPNGASKEFSGQDSRILFPNYPFYVIVAAQTLRTNFPSSPLPLSIIPTLKLLGRSSYALGATTSLYKILIRTAWLQYGSYAQICSLLQDMDNGGIECDYGIFNLLEEIINEYTVAREGRLGRPMQSVLGMEQFDDGMKSLRAWREMAAKKLGTWSEQRVEQGGIVRRVVPTARGETLGRDAPTGPKDELLLSKDDSDLDGDTPPVEGDSDDVRELFT